MSLHYATKQVRQARSVSSPDCMQAGGSRFKAALMKRMLIRVSELDK
jgi:hypothetical protein